MSVSSCFQARKESSSACRHAVAVSRQPGPPPLVMMPTARASGNGDNCPGTPLAALLDDLSTSRRGMRPFRRHCG
ncbi:hypothetical protein ACFPRL_24825 [Pseudoclavibacter helvolus]